MKTINRKVKLIVFLLTFLMQFILISTKDAQAATSPDLGTAGSFSVLGGAAVTCTGATTTSGAVGVSPGTSITGFPSPCSAGGGTHANDATAIAAQASTVAAFTALDQTCDFSYGAQDLTLISPLSPGVYCSTSSFSLSGNLTLAGSGVWIFKTVSTLITSTNSSVTGGDACNVWWRIGSAATLGSNTSFIGNILTANVADTTAMNSGATLAGRILAQAAATVTLDGNTITSPSCGAAGSSSGSGSGASSSLFCPVITDPAPVITESRRVDSDSIFIKWAQYTSNNTFNIQYGTTNGEWLYSVNVTGFSTTLNNLPEGQPIWVRIAPRNNCGAVGVYGIGTFVGGPRLPDTGVFQSSWKVPVGFLICISVLIILLKRKSMFSSSDEIPH